MCLHGADKADEALKTRKDLYISQLARKHPVSFFQFLDRCTRSEQLRDACAAAPYFVRYVVHGCAKVGTTGLVDLLSSPAATAALASAVCSAFKLWTATNTHSTEQRTAPAAAAAAAAAGPDEVKSAAAAAATFLHSFSKALPPAVQHIASEVAAGRSSSSTLQQALTSALLLVVLVSRCLLRLAEAVGDAGNSDQQLLVFIAIPCFPVRSILRFLELNLDQTSAALAAAQAGTAAVGTPLEHGGSSNSSSSSSNSSQPVRWQYLLRLLESRKLAQAVTAFNDEWTAEAAAPLLDAIAQEDVAGTASSPAAQQQQQQQQQAPDDVSESVHHRAQQLFADTLTLCKVLTAVAPLPVVCNNPKCTALHGVSEAAAARYVCAGCGCRYCSAACQAASWRGHKKACRRMAACGMRVEG
jgi:hypothetical protein